MFPLHGTGSTLLYFTCSFCFSIREKYLVPPFLVPALLGFTKKANWLLVRLHSIKLCQCTKYTYWNTEHKTAKCREKTRGEKNEQQQGISVNKQRSRVCIHFHCCYNFTFTWAKTGISCMIWVYVCLHSNISVWEQGVVTMALTWSHWDSITTEEERTCE